MKLGCHVSALKNPRKAPYEEAIERAGQLGFDGVELIAMDRPRSTTTTRPGASGRCAGSARSRRSRSRSSRSSRPPARAWRASIRRSARPASRSSPGRSIARDLGAPLVNLVAHWPLGLEAPIAYPPTYI